MKWTSGKIRNLKGKQKIAVVTAYDALTASMVDAAGLPMVLVGDSLGMTVLGYETTLPVSMDEMVHHTAAVSRGVKSALVVADLPFMSYQPSLAMGLENAGRFLKEASADAVKVEGGVVRAELIAALVENGIPVVGHVGLTPQSVKQTGYAVQGKTSEQARQLLDDAMAVEQAGAFAMVLECVPAELGEMISKSLSIPTIGIGAGAGCDGQVLVFTDLLGMSGSSKHPKFVKQYVELHSQMVDALSSYKQEVEEGLFPSKTQEY